MMDLHDRLEKAWADEGRYRNTHRTLTFTKRGLEIGNGTVVVKYSRDDWNRRILCIDGQEESILALLSVAWDQPMPDGIIEHFHSASRAFSKGELSLAHIHLAYTGLQPLEADEENLRLLFMAEGFLRAGVPGNEIRKAWGLGRSNFRKVNPNVCEQPRDDHGCWTASGYATAKTPEQILADAKAAGGWLTPKDVKPGNEKQCVSLAREVIPELPKAWKWEEGAKLSDRPAIAPGTAIATFNDKGKYKSPDEHPHTAIFLGYGTVGNEDGIWVLDQGGHRAAQRTFYPYGRRNSPNGHDANEFSVIKKPKK